VEYFEIFLELGVSITRIIFVHSWEPAVSNELFPRIAGGIWWNEVGYSSLIILLGHICFQKSTLSTMLQEGYPEEQLLAQFTLNYSLEDNSTHPSIDKLTSFLSQVRLYAG
jgi:hypothetical protein